MKQIYVVMSYYQLIVAIQIKKTIYPNDFADIIITDSSADYLQIANNLKGQNVFKNVFTAVTNKKNGAKSNVFEKVIRAINIVLNNNNFPKKCCNINGYDYDEFLFFNNDYFVNCLYFNIKKNNPRLIRRRFEEGYVSYFGSPELFMSRSGHLQHRLEAMYNHTNMYEADEMFFYEPDLVLLKDNYKKITLIPKIDRNNLETVSILNSVFNYKKDNEYDRKYIFFEQPFLQDDIKIDDLNLVLKIADKVGKENLMVKLHPRSRTDRFSKYGIKTNKIVSTPWEIVIMNNAFSDKVFLTISSGSVLSPRIIFGDTPPTYMLFNCIPQKERKVVTSDFLKFLTEFKNKFCGENFIIPKNIDEFFEMLQ